MSSDKNNKASESETRVPLETEASTGARAERPDLYVLSRVIEVLKEKGAMKRTALSTACGLAYNRFVRYAEWMRVKQFVSIDDDGNIRLTAKGLEAYDSLVTWILENVGKLKFSK